MRATVIAMAGLLAIAVVALPPAVDTLIGTDLPSPVTEAEAVVCIEDMPGGCCDTPVHEAFGIDC